MYKISKYDFCKNYFYFNTVHRYMLCVLSVFSLKNLKAYYFVAAK